MMLLIPGVRFSTPGYKIRAYIFPLADSQSLRAVFLLLSRGTERTIDK